MLSKKSLMIYSQKVKKLKAHISCPIAIPSSTLIKYANAMKLMGMEVSYWDRSSNYSDRSLRDCDVFLLMAPNNGFKLSFSSLPPGCQKELNQAKSLGKPLFLLYTPSSSLTQEVKAYQLSTDGRILEGVPGSTGLLTSKISEFNKRQKELETKGNSLDSLLTSNTGYGGTYDLESLGLFYEGLVQKSPPKTVTIDKVTEELMDKIRTWELNKPKSTPNIPTPIKVAEIKDESSDPRLLLRRRR